jgi:hypothetical protein
MILAMVVEKFISLTPHLMQLMYKTSESCMLHDIWIEGGLKDE